MNSCNELNKIKSKNILNDVKSLYILKGIINHVYKKNLLNIIRYNKNLQNKFNIELNDYKELSEIEIELIPDKKHCIGKFINISNQKERPYYHIFFNDQKEEIKRNYLVLKDNVYKIKIIISNHAKSINELFKDCRCVAFINFINIKRDDIDDISKMFAGCPSLKTVKFEKNDTIINEKPSSIYKSRNLI